MPSLPTSGAKQEMVTQSLFLGIDIDELLFFVGSHRTQNAELAKRIGKSATAVKAAVETVAESFSGSWFGWHAETYYGNFEKPPWGQLFDVEWGAYHGLPPAWQPRTKADVDKRVEELSQHSLIELSKQQWVLARVMNELRDDFLARLAPISNVNGMVKERELLHKLDGYRWDESAHNEFVLAAKKGAPHTTRDSGAAIQGFKLPQHIECAGLAYSAEKFAINAEEFWDQGVRLTKHLKAHAAVAVQSTPESDRPLDVVLSACQKFHLVATELQSRHEKRPTLAINDEYDVQDLLRALLKQHFEDVRCEEPVPSCAGRAPRMDLLLKVQKIAVEVKMTRDGLRDKEIGDELLQDVARYKNHPDCSTLVCFIYDPKGLLKNPHGLASDIEKQSDPRLTVKLVTCPSRA
jgi:hypothetical protein